MCGKLFLLTSFGLVGHWWGSRLDFCLNLGIKGWSRWLLTHWRLKTLNWCLLTQWRLETLNWWLLELPWWWHHTTGWEAISSWCSHWWLIAELTWLLNSKLGLWLSVLRLLAESGLLLKLLSTVHRLSWLSKCGLPLESSHWLLSKHCWLVLESSTAVVRILDDERLMMVT